MFSIDALVSEVIKKNPGNWHATCSNLNCAINFPLIQISPKRVANTHSLPKKIYKKEQNQTSLGFVPSIEKI